MKIENLNTLIYFWVILASMLGAMGLLHYYAAVSFEDVNADYFVLIYTYGANFVMAAIIYTTLHILSSRFKDQIGFLFLGSSFLKFLIFFAIFQPLFKADGHTSNYELGSFLLPYFISLFCETFFLIKLLNIKD